MNEETYQANRYRPLGEVLTDFHETFEQTLSAIDSLTDEELLSREHWGWLKGQPLWLTIAYNTSDHYPRHEDRIRQWLEED